MYVRTYVRMYVCILLMVQKLNCHDLSIFPNSSPILFLYKSYLGSCPQSMVISSAWYWPHTSRQSHVWNPKSMVNKMFFPT